MVYCDIKKAMGWSEAHDEELHRVSNPVAHRNDPIPIDVDGEHKSVVMKALGQLTEADEDEQSDGGQRKQTPGSGNADDQSKSKTLQCQTRLPSVIGNALRRLVEAERAEERINGLYANHGEEMEEATSGRGLDCEPRLQLPKVRLVVYLGREKKSPGCGTGGGTKWLQGQQRLVPSVVPGG